MAAAGNPKAQRVVLVSAGGAYVAGGPAQPIKQMPAGTPTSGAPVIRICLVADGRAKQGGPVVPAYAT